MSNITRHVGKVKNTGTKCVVVFRKIPGNESAGVPDDYNHALVVEIGALPDMYHDNLQQVLTSAEGQQAVDFYTVLHRRSFADGTNMLTTLHNRGWLKKVPVDNVILHPFPNQTLELRLANNTIDNVESRYDPSDKSQTESVADEDKDSAMVRAQGLIARAALLEEESKRLKEEAYALAPEIRPYVGKTKLTPEERQRRKEESNIKRRKGFDEETHTQ